MRITVNEDEKTTEDMNLKALDPTQDETPKKPYAGKGNLFFFILYMAGNLILVNLLFLVCSLPILTLGASLTALNKTVYKIYEDTDVSVVKTFFRAFASNFGQATGAWLILGSITALIGIDIYYCLTTEGSILKIAMVAAGAVILWMVATIFAYVFMLISRYENRFVTQMINAFLIGFRNIGWTFIIWVTWFLGVGIFIGVPGAFQYAGWLFFTGLFSLLVLANCPIYRHIFYKLEQKDESKTDLY